MKTIKKVSIEPLFLKDDEFMPEKLEEGILYISERYGVAIHLCLCGCGNKVVTPIKNGKGGVHDKHSWDLIKESDKITLSPSILTNWDCNSHYIITKNIANFV